MLQRFPPTTTFQTDGFFHWVSTYDGNVDYSSFDNNKLERGHAVFRTEAQSAQELADEIYNASDYVDPKYGELRVWCVAGVRNGNGPGGWELAERNRHKTPDFVETI